MRTVQSMLRFSLLNLAIVAILGLLMRYKIGFSFPFLEQKNLLHAHSHFAFSGWVGHTLMVLLVYQFKDNPAFCFKKYRLIFLLNLIASYGMLIFFVWQGYAAMSIFFSTGAMLISFAFAYRFTKDLRQTNADKTVRLWFGAAAFFSVFSAAGTLVLVYLMANRIVSEELYLSSIYYYLHFQYNGWFFFGCMGLFYAFAGLRDHPFYRTTFWIFALSCIPAYFLSTLWLDLPMLVYVLTVGAAAAQVFAWFRFLAVFCRSEHPAIVQLTLMLRRLLAFVAIAVSIKLLLQLGSTVPQLSQLAFGFRPIVIAYLHLVLLAIISLFLLFFIFANALLPISRVQKTGLAIFSIGVVANELILALQGGASFYYFPIPFVNEMLFGASIILALGAGTLAFAAFKKA